MSYIHVYSTRINWENEPSITSPINATNLNKMDYALKAMDDTFGNWDITKANESDLLLALKDVSYDTDTGVFVFTWFNGTTSTIDLNIEKIPVSFSMDANGVITMTTEDGTTYTADVGALIKTYTFADSSVIDFTVTTDASGNKTVTADIVSGSIDGTKLTPNYLADCTQAKTGAETAATNSATSSQDAEAWAVGTRGGVPVPSTDPAYENNAEYWAHHTSASLAGLNDVNITNPQDKQALTYDANTGEWINGAAAGGAEIDDTTTSTTKVWSSSKTNTELSTKANSADVPTKSQITNPNLLDNPWFTINQRGESSYASGTLRYTVDRWQAFSTESVVVNSNGSVTLSNASTSNIGGFQQYLESSLRDNLLGRTVTVSAIVDDVLYNDTFTMPATVQTSYLVGYITIGDMVLRLRFNASQVLCFYFEHNANSSNSYTIKAVKLELGSISTLALDTAPNYATELLKCQRYFISTKTENTPIFGYIHSDTVARVSFPLNTEMRTVPVIVNSLLNTNAQLLYKGTGYTFTGQNLTFRIITMNSIVNSIVCVIEISGFANLPTSEVCVLKTNGNVLALSADL